MLTTIWTVRNRSYAPRPIDYDFRDRQLIVPHSYAWYCGICGEVWARRVVLGSKSDPEWIFWQTPCIACGRTRNCFQLPGSLLHAHHDLIESMPDDLLAEEVLIQSEELYESTLSHP
ncbi:hypothetical protein FJY94_06605 [Candidatus Kaiserbacteria bacterium]|nr:hypothetical protein [Candidatus Kaiserbacteria bacterium]